MATFAKSTFNAARYAASRPTYPRSLFETILNYHEKSLALPGASAEWSHALDLGCGTGQATVELLNSASVQDGDELSRGFERVTGLDPSAKMIKEATAYAATLGAGASTLKFIQSPAEDLSAFRDESVDLVIAAQAAHWFDWQRMWPELSRVLRHGGTAAFWVYSEFRLPQYPQLTPLITEYAQGTDRRTSLGPHWEPGRAILNNHLLDIVPPATGWADFTRVFFTGDYYPDLPGPQLEVILRKRMTWGGAGLHGYLRTFSALHRFQEAFPADRNHKDGDMAVRFLKELMAKAEVPLGEAGEAQEVEVEWPLALIVARKELDPRDPWLVRKNDLRGRIGEVQSEYNEKHNADTPPADLEAMTARMDEWIDVQEKVLDMVEEDLESLPATVDGEYEAGRERYVAHVEEIGSTVNWHITFRRAFDYALEAALAAEEEVGRENIEAGVTRWLQLMEQRALELAPAVGRDNMEEAADPLSALALTEEQLEGLTDEESAAYEEASAVGNIVYVIQEMLEAIDDEPISELVREMYISALSEATAEAVVDETEF
ncbi:S-adenosyl-L-methionine-dependent methyltransferase [Mycena latifolia]|nr:S-adenosyl-L-methionine-dependent methyltransferase [Mycena latifolia]